ncbi:ImmA/IrrE family metallo-endopeptidase [Veillonella caviae]|uniref:ImmA/IrrE family metallo-endopeptidase n=1 Tax=Veillonella caviae TaxID=248316 RepID=UPI002A91A4CE|nr:ImmA/IrrE family metallo-endopeptidase [Veillonella caviae]MDY6225353.1 ImmA/IrrE family metallo-endopeptidase [Veillonella caviae]
MTIEYKSLPNKPRYEYAKNKAYELLDRLNIKSYPIDLNYVFETLGIKLISIQAAEPLLSASPEISSLLSVKAFQDKSIDALTTIIPTFGYVTFYDYSKSNERIQFTLAHELGHIILDHCLDFKETQYFRSKMTESQYKVLEKEADTFAGAFVRPANLVMSVNEKYTPLTVFNVSDLFSISLDAASVCLQIVNKFCQNPRLKNEERINFVESQFYEFLNAKYCTICGCTFVSSSAKYCPICGNTPLKWNNNSVSFIEFYRINVGGQTVMNYNTYPVNPITGAVSECPQCENEITHSEWNYCPICSLPTLNKCSSCGKQLAPHFRYCHECGKESIYFLENALKSWDVEAARIKAELEESNMPNSYDILY